MISKEAMIGNINNEIEVFKKCIEELEYQKQFIKDLNDDVEKDIDCYIDEYEDEKFLYATVKNHKCYVVFSRYSHLYEKNFML
jgi:hypothetical protein